jgi:hypothetical protein
MTIDYKIITTENTRDSCILEKLKERSSSAEGAVATILLNVK